MAGPLPDAEADFHMHMADQYKLMFQAMRGQGVVDEPLFEGVAELIERLDADGWLLGVATGKSDRGLNLCIASHGLSARFVTLQTADRLPSNPHQSIIEKAMADEVAVAETRGMNGYTSVVRERDVDENGRSLV